MLLPSLLVTTLLYVVHAETNLTEEVQAFVSKYREMNETADVIRSLERIGADSRELFLLGRSAGHLLSTFNESGQATEEEVRALNTLHVLFAYPFHQRQMDSTMHYHYEGYSFGVELDVMRKWFDNLTNATYRASTSEESIVGHVKFLRSLKAHVQVFDPLALIEKLDTASRVGCRLPTKKGIRTIARLQEAMLRIENEGRHTWNTTEYVNVQFYKELIFGLLASQKSEKHAETFIETLDNLNSTAFDDVMLALRSSHVNMSVSSFSVVTFNMTALLMKLEMIHKELVRIQLLEWAISSVTEYDEEFYEKDMEIIVLMVERTTKFMLKWTRTVQTVSWPDVGIEFAKRLIECDSVPFDVYNETASKVRKAFEEHGSLSHAYQVLVVPTSEVGASWSVGSSRIDDYTNITNFKGLDIHVFRFNKTEAKNRSENAKKWMEKNKKGIMKEIRTGALVKASSILNYIQSESSIGPIYSDNLFRSVILLKKIKNWPGKPEMPIGFAISDEASYKMDITRTSYSVLEHGRETVYMLKAFFFL